MKLRYFRHEETVTPYGSTDARGYIDVTPEQAGRPPDPRLMEAMLELRDATADLEHERAVGLRAEITTLDYGEGLLAQDTWQAVTPKFDKKEDDK